MCRRLYVDLSGHDADLQARATLDNPFTRVECEGSHFSFVLGLMLAFVIGLQEDMNPPPRARKACSVVEMARQMFLYDNKFAPRQPVLCDRYWVMHMHTFFFIGCPRLMRHLIPIMWMQA